MALYLIEFIDGLEYQSKSMDIEEIEVLIQAHRDKQKKLSAGLYPLDFPKANMANTYDILAHPDRTGILLAAAKQGKSVFRHKRAQGAPRRNNKIVANAAHTNIPGDNSHIPVAELKNKRIIVWALVYYEVD